MNIPSTVLLHPREFRRGRALLVVAWLGRRGFPATLLRSLGLDHEQLTYRFGGREYRLTDVHGQIMKAILT